MSKKSRRGVSMLLVQVRDHAQAAAQERQCFLDRCGLEPHQMRVHNVIENPVIDWRAAADVDVVMIGGAGAHSATEEHPFTAPLAELLARTLDEDKPFFGSCWGHQFMADVLGGSVIHDPERAEVGTFDVELTAAGSNDPLLSGAPERFAVQLGHNDRIGELPPGIEVLAATELCPHQIIRVAGKPAYGSQFHSEMTDDDMRVRVRMYRDEYLAGEGADEAFERRLRPSPVADGLLGRFLDLFV